MEMQDSPSWGPGSVVGSYSLLAKLATGGMAEIWLARQSGLKGFERLVVVKRIIESLSADEAFVEMFLDEARIIVQLTHPNIVQVFDLGEHAGAYYIAMEYLAGENLATVARTAAKAGLPLSTEVSVKLAAAALDGLAHAHTRTGVDGKPLNVVHRDVSPQNIVLTWDGQVKLVDFGIARAANRSTQTQGNQLKGKFAYMAPEQARGEPVDGRADVFAMGVVLWELVTHRRFYNVDDSVQILRQLIGNEPIEPPHRKNPEVPKDLSAIIMKSLAKDVDARFPDAHAFKVALEDWLRARGGGPSTGELASMMKRLFQGRIAERQALIETASRGEVSPSRVGEVMRPPSERSMPGRTSFLEGDGKLVAAAVGALVLVLIAGVMAWRAINPPLEAPPEVEYVQEPPPPPKVVEPPGPPPVPVVVERPSSIVVETEPPGGAVTLDGKAVGVAPLTVPGVPPGDHVIEASAPGRQAVKRTVTVNGEGDKLMMVLSLPAEAKPEKRPEAAPAAQKGKLSLSTDPWTRVTLNGKVLGDTPLIELPLPAGRHRLQLTNEQAKLDLTIEVEVKPGQLTKKVLRL